MKNKRFIRFSYKNEFINFYWSDNWQISKIERGGCINVSFAKILNKTQRTKGLSKASKFSPFSNESVLTIVDARQLVNDGHVDAHIHCSQETHALLVVAIVDLPPYGAHQEPHSDIPCEEKQDRSPLK